MVRRSFLGQRRRARRHWGGWPLVIAALAASVMVAVVIAIGVINSPNQSLAGAARPNCSYSGCAVVSLSRTFPPTAGAQITLPLNEGKLSLTGTRKANARVTGTGTLVVELSGSPTAPELKFTETGLTKAESSLGLVSPFNVGGSPLIVPVQIVKAMSGC